VFVLAGSCFISGVVYRLSTLSVVPTAVACTIAAVFVVLPSIAVFRLDMRAGSAYEEFPPVFLCPFMPLFPIAGVATTTFLLTQLPVVALLGMFGWLGIAMCIYIWYGMHNSVADSHSLLNNQSLSTYDGADGSSPKVSSNEIM
jgi:C-terminus of AA_permease